MNTDYEEMVVSLGRPKDWTNAKLWKKWLDNIASALEDNLWPSFNQKTLMWKGKATPTAVALTTEEIAFMSDFHKRLDTFVAGQSTSGFIKHRTLFAHEDEKIGDKLEIYNFESSKFFDQYRGDRSRNEWFDAAIERNAMAPVLDLKTRFQRPRPYQCSVLLKLTKFKQEFSHSFITPSLPSGHCFQAIMGLLELYMRLKHASASNKGLIGSPSSIMVDLAVYAAHIGDRRVMAGLHYPTDNMASWYFAYELAKKLRIDDFPASAEAEEFVKCSVKKSLVYADLALPTTAKNFPILSARFVWVKKQLGLP